MAATYDFSMTRDGLIKSALRVLGFIKPGTEPPTVIVTDVAEALNMMMKTWQVEGIGLWLNKTATLYLAYNTASFTLGPSGTHASETVVETTLSADAEEAATTVTLTSVTGVASTYYIGIELDDGTRQWTTVSGAPSGYVVTLAAELTGAATSGNTVYVYQTKIQRPILISNAMLRDASGNDRPLNIISRQEYLALSDKDSIGTPVSIYYDPQVTNGVLYVWPTNDDVDKRIVFNFRKPLADFDAATDVPDLPVEWMEAIKYNLALRIAPEYMDDIAEDRMKYIVDLAARTKNTAMSYDAEMTSLFFQPDISR